LSKLTRADSGEGQHTATITSLISASWSISREARFSANAAVAFTYEEDLRNA